MFLPKKPRGDRQGSFPADSEETPSQGQLVSVEPLRGKCGPCARENRHGVLWTLPIETGVHLTMECNHENEQTSHRTRISPGEQILKGQRMTTCICFLIPGHSHRLLSILVTRISSPFGSLPKAHSCPPAGRERQNSFQR